MRPESSSGGYVGSYLAMHNLPIGTFSRISVKPPEYATYVPAYAGSVVQVGGCGRALSFCCSFLPSSFGTLLRHTAVPACLKSYFSAYFLVAYTYETQREVLYRGAAGRFHDVVRVFRRKRRRDAQRY